MATVNLGSIKFNWKGSYSGATAYVVDDVVESGGNSYVCIAATTGNTPPNATYWELMSQKGTDGADADLLSISGTVQGDLYYNNGSAIARLAIGSAGQALKVNSGATGFEFGTAGGIIQSVSSNNNSFGQNYYGSTLTDIESSSGVAWETTITPTSSSSGILLLPMLMLRTNPNAVNEGRYDINMQRKIGAGSYQVIWNMYEAGTYDRGGNGIITADVYNPIFVDSPNTTSAVTYKFQMRSNSQELSTTWGGSPTAIQRLTLLEIGV